MDLDASLKELKESHLEVVPDDGTSKKPSGDFRGEVKVEEKRTKRRAEEQVERTRDVI